MSCACLGKWSLIWSGKSILIDRAWRSPFFMLRIIMNTNEQPKILHHFFDRTHKLTDSVFERIGGARNKFMGSISIDDNFNRLIGVRMVYTDCRIFRLVSSPPIARQSCAGIRNGKCNRGRPCRLAGAIGLLRHWCAMAVMPERCRPILVHVSQRILWGLKGFWKVFLDHKFIQFFTEKMMINYCSI